MTCENEKAAENEKAVENGKEMMDIDIADASNGGTTRIKEIKENGLLLWPVSTGDSGEGLPFAPENWPGPGDNWGWRVGKRVAVSGFFLDRYLYLPVRFQKSGRKRDGFASKLSAANYVRAKFPGRDVEAFFSSFSWKIPSHQAYLLKDEHGSLHISPEEMVDQSPSGRMPGVAVCKAGNRLCSSVAGELVSPLSASQSCDICCSEPGFCRDCCCILCCSTIDLAFGGYSFIRCEATVSDGSICSHAAHVNCALRSYMAGTVGGSVGLDTEYYCRRCDTRTDLTKHVTSLLKTCESIASQDDVKKILSIGSCILRGSQKKASQKLLSHIESVLNKKLKSESESELKDIMKAEVDVDVAPVATGEVENMNMLLDKDIKNSRHESEYLKLEDDIDNVLTKLKMSQEQEFKTAQEKLLSQKEYINCLYEHIKKIKTELVQPMPSPDRNAMASSISVREEHLMREFTKLKDMEKIANGFGGTPKNILKEHFGFDLED